MSPGSLRARALDFFIDPPETPPASRPSRVEPRDATPEPGRPRVEPRDAPRATAGDIAFLPPSTQAPRASGRAQAATRMPLRAAVLGSAAEAVPVGALLANALRAAARRPAAALAAWTPGVAAMRGGPATLAAARLAARLSARGLPAVARGRLSWQALDDHPVAAAVSARRAAGALDVPLVVVLCGPRCEVVEGLLAEQDLVLVVAADPDGPLARLAVAGCATAALACAPPAPGPARWLARSGLGGARGLPGSVRSLVRELAPPTVAERTEVAW